MSVSAFVERQIAQVRREGGATLSRKLRKAARYAALGVPVAGFVCAIRLIRPWLLVRIGMLSQSIGHFAVDTELHLCETDAGINVPEGRHVNLYFVEQGIICNRQLARMWKRVLHIWPEWFLVPVLEANRLLPGAAAHEMILTANEDRDIFNLFDRFPPHLRFTPDEEARGRAGLRAMGIPPGAPYVCLIVRDARYLAVTRPMHDQSDDSYRDSDIRNFVPASLELAGRGYYVIRMGAHVRESMPADHPKIIDYAVNGMRGDFMDVYLGATCDFCMGSATGYLGVPHAFRRPVVSVDVAPLGHVDSFWQHTLSIAKHHYSIPEKRELTLREIFERGAGYCVRAPEYEAMGIRLVGNSPEEIRDVAIEMAERLGGTWQPDPADEILQRHFWEIFSTHLLAREDGKALHGEIRGRFGAAFLRSSRAWAQ